MADAADGMKQQISGEKEEAMRPFFKNGKKVEILSGESLLITYRT